MKFYLLLFLSVAFSFAFAQKPNDAYRLPVTPDMPEWAKKLYQYDIEVNLFELDKEFVPWKKTYDSLKAEVALAGTEASESLKFQFGYYKKYVKYYTRWRGAVYPYVQENGTLVFTELPVPEAPPTAGKTAAVGWTQIGPFQTHWNKNDNAAQPLAPWQANVYSIDVAPGSGDILYYGTETGVVGKTTDKGLTWTTVGANYFTDNIGAIAIHPSNPDIVYAGENGRISTTTDGGATWVAALTVASFNPNDIKIKPDAPDVVLAAGASLRRRTAGNIWSTILNSKTYDLAFNPANPQIVYALVNNAGQDLCEFWKSTDGGQTFTIRSSGWLSGLTDGGGRLTVSDADANRVYAILLTGSGPRLMRSDDAGETWTVAASAPLGNLTGTNVTGPLGMSNGQGFYDLSIVASHTNADQIILGTTSAYKSTDGGATFAPLGGYHGPFQPHPDFQEMVARGGDTWIVTDGGINLSTDFYTNPAVGVNYFVRIVGMTGTEYWGFDSGWNEDVLVGGRYHNGNSAWRSSYPAGDHLRMGGGEAATGYVNPGNASMTYFSDIGGKILPATIDQTVQSFSVTKWPNERFYPLEGGEQEWDPRYINTYFLGEGNQFWKTTDNGLNFTSLFTHSSATAEIRYVEVSRSNPDVIYFTVYVSSPSDDGELWKTTDGGANWAKCNNPGTLTASQRRFSKITLSGTDANTIWWAFKGGPNGQKVFKSTDGGSTWSNWTTTTLNNLNASDILHQLGTNGGVYFVTGNGGKIYYRDNAASDWTAFNTGLPLNLYGDFGGVIAKPYYKGGKLRLGTGNGIWESDLFTTSTTTLVQPMTNNGAPTCSRDTVQLESYSVVNGSATYQWSFSPTPQWISNPNIRNPRVVLGATPGFFSATLTITDDNGVTTRTVNNLINNLPNGNLCAADTIPGKSLMLDGNGDVAIPNTNLNLNSNTVSMTAWIKRNGTQVDFAGILYARGGTTSSGLSITSGNQLRYTWNDAAGSYGFSTGLTVPDNAWTHIALVITPADAKVYMNGVAATRTAAHATEAFDTPVKIGLDNGSRYFKGEIDEVTIWNKSLTQNEIRELMHLTVVPSAQPNLVSYYQFNEPSGIANDKVSTRHASLSGNAARVVSTGPFGGGSSSRQSVTTGGLKTFPGTDVLLAFPAAGTYPNGEIVVNRINLAPDSLPLCSTYASASHYWIIDNYGANQTFTTLDSARFGNISVPATNVIPSNSYRLNKRSVNAHLSNWSLSPGVSSHVTGGSSGNITFDGTSNITQLGQFIATNSLDGQIISGVSSVCSGENITLDAGTGYTTYNWSGGGGSGQTATYNGLTSTTTYTVTVTQSNGCTGSAMKTVTVHSLPTPAITPGGPTTFCAGGNVVLNSSAGSTYLWSNGATIQSVTAASSGTYTVAVTDGNGCTGTSAPVSVTVNPLPTPTITPGGPTTFCAGGNVVLTSSAGSSYLWSTGATTQSVTASSGGTYTVVVTDGNGCTGTSAPVIVTIDPCSGSGITISGNITWENNNAPAKDVSVALKTLPGLSSVTSQLSDINGNYTLVSPTTGDFRIIPTKNINLLNGVTAADASRIQQHVVNNPPLAGPYKRIAADVNKSNTITTYDATLITQAIAGNPAALAIFNTSWRFVPVTYTFPNPNIPWGFPEKIDLINVTTNQINQDFKGVKLGDVNGTANPLLKPGAPVTWVIEDKVLKTGETIKVDFAATDFYDIAAYQFAVGFDPAFLELGDIQSSGKLDLTADNFGTFDSKQGEIRAVWSTSSGRTMDNGTVVFSVEFNVLKDGKNLSDLLHLDETSLVAHAYNTALVETGIGLAFNEVQISGTNDPLYTEMRTILLQNKPNPFSESTLIGFILPQNCDARLRIIDLNGRVLAEWNKNYSAGYHQEEFVPAGHTGVCFYELTTPFGTVSKKMTVLK